MKLRCGDVSFVVKEVESPVDYDAIVCVKRPEPVFGGSESARRAIGRGECRDCHETQVTVYRAPEPWPPLAAIGVLEGTVRLLLTMVAPRMPPLVQRFVTCS